MWTTAVVLRDGQYLETEEIDLPQVGEGQLLVRISGVGICHTDLLFRDSPVLGSKPLVLGHEGAGVVEQVGPGVEGIGLDDHVVLSFDSCGTCPHCLAGHPAYCSQFLRRNLSGGGLGDAQNGVDRAGQRVATRWFGQSSFASYAIATTRNAVVIDPQLPLALAGPLGCGFLTGAASVVNVCRLTAGDSLAVVGVGGVGIAAVMMAAHLGGSRVVAVDLLESRLERAEMLGATHRIGKDEAAQDLTAAILSTGGPVSHVIDTTGNPGVIRHAVDAMAPRGVCAIAGVQRADLTLGPRSLAMGKTLTAIYEGDAVPQRDIPHLVKLWKDGEFPLEQTITTYPMSSFEEAETDMRTGRTLKPVLIP